MTLSPSFQSTLLRINNPYYDKVEPLPWVEKYRRHQIHAIDTAVSAFDSVDMVVLDAPTGSGKTLIADTVRQLLGVRSNYICSTKTLQDQVARDFPYGQVLKGRVNYPTEKYPERFNDRFQSLTTGDCTKTPGIDDSCNWCTNIHNCPYERAKAAALRSPLAVLNTSYFLTEGNGPGRFSGRGLVIADEADTLESELMNYVSVVVSETRLGKYGLRVPKISVEQDWKDWVDEAKPVIERELLSTEGRLFTLPDDLPTIREGKYLSGLHRKLQWVKEGLESGTWIYTGNHKEVSFKPVKVDKLGKEYLWKLGKKWLLMSATVISPAEMLASLGWDKPYQSIALQSNFPPANRKVIVKLGHDMSKAGKEAGSIEGMVKDVASIISANPEHRTLIHSVSYDLSEAVGDSLKKLGREVYSYGSAGERERTLELFRNSEAGILTAPSMDRGIDLPHDACRIQIICKVPYLSLGDKQVQKRLFGGGQAGQTWYACQAIRSIVQMTGRAVRSADDWAVTYILDNNFQRLYAQNRNLFPAWWSEGLIWER